jgi:hypothetical protein
MIMLFGISASGATVRLHYCCGKLKSISFGYVQEDCKMDGKMGSKPCCETKSISAKEQTKGHELYTVAVGVNAPVESIILFPEAPEPVISGNVVALPAVHSSPPLIKDIALMNCVFRI